jgi:hypothetical protein
MMIVEMLEELGHRVVAEAGSIQTAEPLARTSYSRSPTSRSIASRLIGLGRTRKRTPSPQLKIVTRISLILGEIERRAA